MGTGYFRGIKRPGRGVDHPPHLAPRLKKEQSYTYTPPLGLHGLFQGEHYLYLLPSSMLGSGETTACLAKPRSGTVLDENKVTSTRTPPPHRLEQDIFRQYTSEKWFGVKYL